jgi:hypothetical protein
LSPALIEQFLEQQTQELTIRREDLQLRRRELDVSFQYAEKSLAAQVEDRRQARDEQRRARRDRLWFLGAFMLVVAAFFAGLLYMGKDKFAEEALKGMVFFLTGGTGGYFAGKQQGKKQQADEDS